MDYTLNFTDLFQMVEGIQYRKSSFLASEEWRTIPWQLTPKDIYQKLYDIGFSLGAYLEQYDRAIDLLSSTKIEELKSVLQGLTALDVDIDSWYEELCDSVHSPIFWPSQTDMDSYLPNTNQVEGAPHAAELPHFNFLTLRLGHIVVSYWALRIILSNTIATTCNIILSNDFEYLSRHSDFNEYRARAQRLFKRHGNSDILLAYATNIMRSMRYCLNDSMGFMGAHKSLFGIRVALTLLRQYPGEELRWCNSVYQSMDSNKGVRYAREVANFNCRI